MAVEQEVKPDFVLVVSMLDHDTESGDKEYKYSLPKAPEGTAWLPERQEELVNELYQQVQDFISNQEMMIDTGSYAYTYRHWKLINSKGQIVLSGGPR